MPPRRSIDDCGLVYGGRDGCQSGDEEDCEVADVFPEVDDDGGRDKHVVVGEPVVVLSGGEHDGVGELVDQASWLKHDAPDGGGDHG